MARSASGSMPAGALGKRRGFTLVELLVVLAMVAGLTALALPAHWRHSASARRHAAQACLETWSLALARESLADGTAHPGAGHAENTPTAPRCAQPGSANESAYRYTLEPSAGMPRSTLRATAQGRQARDDSGCQVLLLDPNGRRWALDGRGQPATCW